MSVDEKVLKRVQKLLNLANKQKNNSEHEAESAMLLAQKLMMENNLTTDDLQTEEELPKVVYRHAMRTGKPLWWYRQLGHIIADNFRCKFLIAPFLGGESALFLGLESDAEIAAEVCNFAYEAIKYHADRFARKMYANGHPMKGLRDSFTRGFLLGLSEKFTKQVEQNNWLTLITPHPAVIEHYKSQEYGSARATSERKEASSSALRHIAHEAGKQEGLKFNPNTPKLK